MESDNNKPHSVYVVCVLVQGIFALTIPFSSEKRSINKFTLSGGRENANGALQNGDACGLNELRLVQTSTYLCNNKTDVSCKIIVILKRIFALASNTIFYSNER